MNGMLLDGKQYKNIRMIRKHYFKPGDKVKLKYLPMQLNELSPENKKFELILHENRIGEVIRNEDMIPENSNFRYTVKFGDLTVTLNEVQLEHIHD